MFRLDEEYLPDGQAQQGPELRRRGEAMSPFGRLVHDHGHGLDHLAPRSPKTMGIRLPERHRIPLPDSASSVAGQAGNGKAHHVGHSSAARRDHTRI
jgi:hypothetical protein